MYLHIKSVSTGGPHPSAATETIQLYGITATREEDLHCELTVCGPLLGITAHDGAPGLRTCQVVNWQTSQFVKVHLLLF